MFLNIIFVIFMRDDKIFDCNVVLGLYDHVFESTTIHKPYQHGHEGEANVLSIALFLNSPHFFTQCR